MQSLTNRPWYKFYKEDLISLDIPEISLYNLFEKSVEAYGDHIAVIFEDEKITYNELKSRIDHLACKWSELGLQKGERMGLMLGNHPDYMVSYYAAQRLGLIVVQVNPFYTTRELLQILDNAKVSYIVADPIAIKTIQELDSIYSFKYVFLSQMDKEIQQEEYVKLTNLLTTPTPHQIQTAEIVPKEDVAIIQYTGGTTGKVKGAMLTHYNLVANVIQSYSMYTYTLHLGKETVLAATPLYHVYGMTSAMNLGLYMGASILLFRKFETKDVLEKIRKYKPTFFPGVPKMYINFANYPNVEDYGLNCLKVCSSGSAPLPVEVIAKFEKLTNTKILEGFGMSESSPTTHRNPPHAIRKVGSIGIPVPETDSKIVDENDQELAPNCVGELLIRGPQVMKGYWNNEKETRKAIHNDWLYTGDLAIMDQDGYFYIVGRKKEMIILGGFNIYPQEIEGVLYEHPDIKEAAVVGIPHKDEGEVVKAYVVLKEGSTVNPEDLVGYCYTKLTPYKVPKRIEIRDSLPRNTVGKLLKRLLVKEEQERGEGKK